MSLTKTWMTRSTTALLAVSLFAAACGDDDATGTTASTTTIAATTTIAGTTTVATTTTEAPTTTAALVPTRLGRHEVVEDEVGPYIVDDRFPDTMVSVYRPDSAGPWPTVVWLHGGGGLRENQKMPEAIASLGAVVFSATWASTGTFDPGSYEWEAPAAACVVRFARDSAADFGGDPEFFILTGHSAGAILSQSIVLAGDRLDASACTAPGIDPRGTYFVGDEGSDILEYTQWGVEGDLLALLDPMLHLTDNPDLLGAFFVAGRPGGQFRDMASAYVEAFVGVGIESAAFFDDTTSHSAMGDPNTSGGLLYLAVTEMVLDRFSG